MTINLETPYTISIPDSKLSILQQKLAFVTFPDELEDSGWDYGVPLSVAQRLISRWKDGYDWRKIEKQLNEELPQFTRDIEVEGHGVLKIHYVHKKSSKNAIPLLFVHGYILFQFSRPGSFLEVRKILPLLTEPESAQDPSFHVVALSLPGFGFSEAPRKKGFSLRQFAEVCNKLMLSLGYDRYVTQSGDWGFYICRTIAQFYGGKHLIAWHTNYPDAGGDVPTSPDDPSTASQMDLDGYARNRWFFKDSFGYNTEQTSRPQTIGYSLADSPLGLLAWIYEKLVEWSDVDAYSWSDDEALTWISVYWFSEAGPAAAGRIYREVQYKEPNDREAANVCPQNPRPDIPMGWSRFPRDILYYPLASVQKIGNLAYQNYDHKKGGHFPATEVPEALVKDLRQFFRSVVDVRLA
ncbi:hypothetical protein D9758_007109 [Tetrapyrgos nigripes]|uniref:Epoxide hydrolase N-terminal domain-containing protein n=1 Tax=Tetrapyrgos nigripes TaxID=182062 RepID=A0A8H5GDA7_9AGAR|nr:hypothetical protein D9758_007109 [Tetrapyrgos nigripes]